MIDSLASKDDFSKMKENLKHFVRDQDIKDLQKLVVPLCEEVDIKVAQFTSDNHDVKQSVLSFDKLLCQKANKSGLEIIEKHIKDNLLGKDEVVGIIDTQQDTKLAEEIEKMTDLLKVTVSESIEEKCGAIVNAKVSDF